MHFVLPIAGKGPSDWAYMGPGGRTDHRWSARSRRRRAFFRQPTEERGATPRWKDAMKKLINNAENVVREELQGVEQPTPTS